MGVTAAQQKVKDDKARWRAVQSGEIQHVTLGKRRGDGFAVVKMIGMVGDLHGAVCTCCSRRRDTPAAHG